MNKLSALEPAEPVRRYEREKPGELIHIDIKKLGRIGSVGHRITGRYPGAVNRHHGIGWEFVHVCIDDASRVAFVQVMANQRKESAVVFLEAAVAYYAKLGIRIERVMTDNGSCYRSKTFRAVCRPESALSDIASPGDILAQSTVTTAIGWEFVHVCMDDAVALSSFQKPNAMCPLSKAGR